MWTIEGFDGYVDAARDCAQAAMIDAIAEHDPKPCRVSALHEQGVFDDGSIADAELTDIAEGCARCIADAPTPQQ
jgi:hypothetical protein